MYTEKLNDEPKEDTETRWDEYPHDKGGKL